MGVFGSQVCLLLCNARKRADDPQVMSFMAEICAVTIKTHKSSSVRPSSSSCSPSNIPSQSSLLRYHALIALYKSLTTAKRAVTDASGKDILKQMKSALTDKAFPVQRAATQVSSYLMIRICILICLGPHCDVFHQRRHTPDAKRPRFDHHPKREKSGQCRPSHTPCACTARRTSPCSYPNRTCYPGTGAHAKGEERRERRGTRR